MKKTLIYSLIELYDLHKIKGKGLDIKFNRLKNINIRIEL
jgi:hypothetical protein